MAQKNVLREIHKFYHSIGEGGLESMSKTIRSMDLVSGPLALTMLQHVGLDKNSTQAFKLLDNGAGTGIVAGQVQKLVDAAVIARSSIVSGDIAEKMVEVVKARIGKEQWVNTESRVVDAQNIDFPSATFTHVTSNIGLHVIPDSEAALKEYIRVLKPGGMLGFTTWHKHNPGWTEDFRDAFASFDFEAPFTMSMQTTKWGNWTDVNRVRKILLDKGLKDVRVDVQSHLQPVESASEFMEMFSSMLEVLVNASWSEELRREHGLDEVKKLVEGYLEKKYEGRGWDLTWTSIIASGRKPLL